jgi:hypothetical protein
MSRYVSPAESLRQFPTLAARRADGAALKGTVRLVAGVPRRLGFLRVVPGRNLWSWRLEAGELTCRGSRSSRADCILRRAV